MMTALEFKQRWGTDGLVQPPLESLERVPMPAPSKGFLLEAGLPASILIDSLSRAELNFTGLRRGITSVPDLDWQPQLNETQRAKYSRYLVLGDQISEDGPEVAICLDTDSGAVVEFYPEDLDHNPVRILNSSIAQFAACLLVFKETVLELSLNASREESETQATRLEAEIRWIDPAVLNGSSFWSYVVQICREAYQHIRVTYQRVDARMLTERIPDLILLLQDAVNSGASIGFLPPLAVEEAKKYWQSVAWALRENTRVVLIAETKRDGIVGSAQLGLEQRTNQRHRAEVMKLLVHTSARRQGIGRALMEHLELEARGLGRSTLVLDTREGDPSNDLYRSLGWTLVGPIPQYCRDADGTLAATMIYYKLLEG